MSSFRNGGGDFRPRLAVLLVAAVLLASSPQLLAQPRLKVVSALDRGICWTMGYVVPYRAPDGSDAQIIFSAAIPGCPDGVYFYRHLPMNRYELLKCDTGYLLPGGIFTGNLVPWAAGDIDGDSVPELIAFNGEYYSRVTYQLATLYDPGALGNCPDSLVWFDRYDTNAGYSFTPFYLTDLDRDGKKEVTFGVWVYENSGNNSMRLAAQLPPRDGHSYAFGDFDADGRTEFATAPINGQHQVQVYKCTGDDQYALWDTVTPGLDNGHDVFSAENLDGSHRPMLFASFWEYGAGGPVSLCLFEPTQGTRGYRPFLVDRRVRPSDEVNARSICGDIDGDGIDEVLWSIGTGIRVYKWVAPHQFECVWSWNQGVNNSCNLNLYDMNGNGYNEILESGSGVTHIFEIEAIKVLYPNGGQQFRPGDTCRIRWETYNPPRCDSISLFLRSDTAWSLDTIVHGLPPGDTSYRWVVPDVPSSSCRIVAIAYGPGWQYDESDQPFRILSAGVEERPQVLVPTTALTDITPNPLSNQTRIRFQLREPTRVQLRIRDVTGRTVSVLADEAFEPGYYYRDWSVSQAMSLPSGIYFLAFTAGDCRETRKLVLTEGRE